MSNYSLPTYRVVPIFHSFGPLTQIFITYTRFNVGEGQDENAIVTSTGQFVIAWDFAKVKKGLLDRYEIKKYEDKVVQDNFKFNDDKEIVRYFRFL